MKMYDYEVLKNKATDFNATQEDINALGEWFENYGMDFWNGEYFDADDGKRLFPIYKEAAEDEYVLIGYEFK